MAKRRINFDLFQLTINNDEGDQIGFEGLLEDKKNLASIFYRGNPIIVIDKSKPKGKFIFGTLANNQMFDLPSSYDNNTKKLADLPIADTQGLAHYTSFLFDKEMQILVYEVKQSGVNLGVFCSFYEKNFNISPIETAIVPNPTDIKRYNKFTIIKKFVVKIARVQNGAIFSAKKPEVQKLINVADATNSGEIEYTLTAQRKGDSSLSIAFIKNAIKQLLKFTDSQEVEVLQVTGKEDEDAQSDAIDFIKNRFRINIEVESKRYMSSFLLNEKYDAMKTEYMKIRAELLKLYKPKK